MKRSVAIMADAAREAGLGHLARCSAIAVALASRGVDVRCLALDAPMPLTRDGVAWEVLEGGGRIDGAPVDVLLLDSYRHEAGALAARLDAGALVAMHDVGPVPKGLALLITSDSALLDDGQSIIGGPQMACLRPAFWGLPDSPRTPEAIRRVLVTTGGADRGRHAIAIASCVRRTLPATEVTLVRGPLADWELPAEGAVLDRPTSLLGALCASDLVVTAAGQTLYEAMAAGTATIAVPLAENQRRSALVLERRGATEVVEPEALDVLSQRLARLAEKPAECGLRARRARNLVDGYGALRVAYRLASIAEATGAGAGAGGGGGGQ